MNKYHGNAKDRNKPFMNNLIVYHNIEVPSFKYLSWGCVHNHQDNSLKITKFQALWLWYLVSISNIDLSMWNFIHNQHSLIDQNKQKQRENTYTEHPRYAQWCPYKISKKYQHCNFGLTIYLRKSIHIPKIIFFIRNENLSPNANKPK